MLLEYVKCQPTVETLRMLVQGQNTVHETFDRRVRMCAYFCALQKKEGLNRIKALFSGDMLVYLKRRVGHENFVYVVRKAKPRKILTFGKDATG